VRYRPSDSTTGVRGDLDTSPFNKGGLRGIYNKNCCFYALKILFDKMVKIKYILFNFFKLFLISSLCLLSLFFIIQILEDLPDIISGSQKFLLSNYILTLPSSFVLISPLITLLSGMFFVSEMLKANEIKIFEISGINSLKIFSMFLFASFIISSFTFYIKNYVVPKTIKGNEYQTSISFSSPSFLFKSDRYEKDGKFINIEISIILEDGSITSIRAKEGIEKEKNLWTFKEGKFYLIDKNTNLKKEENFNSKTFELPITSEILLVAGKNPDSIFINQLKNTIKELEKMGLSPFLLETYFNEKIAYPSLNLFILFAIFPFFLGKQKITRFLVLSLTIVIGFLSYGIYSFLIALSKSGKIPPFFGCWGLHLFVFISFLFTLFKFR